jgi:hypothetical protein
MDIRMQQDRGVIYASTATSWSPGPHTHGSKHQEEVWLLHVCAFVCMEKSVCVCVCVCMYIYARAPYMFECVYVCVCVCVCERAVE